MSKYNTNLASEFHVLSTLHRLGIDATITLGNKKSVDIVVANEQGEIITIDVKGIEKKYDWPADNIRAPKNSKHFIVLVCYEGQIHDPIVAPNVWIIPYKEMGRFVKQYATRRNISRSLIMKKAQKFYNAWQLLTD